MEDLHHTLKRNSGRVVGIYDEISVMYKQIDINKTGNLDKKQLLTMFNGGSWRRNFQNGFTTVENTWFNMVGFVQPVVIIKKRCKVR